MLNKETDIPKNKSENILRLALDIRISAHILHKLCDNRPVAMLDA